MKVDAIVVGAGHAGCEASLALARMGLNTMVITTNLDKVGWMPCNPAIGGAAKGQMVGEIDALGGQMGRVADETQIQMKVLNRSRGPAVQCLRSQNDKYEYNHAMKTILDKQDNLQLIEAEVVHINVEGERVTGVTDRQGNVYQSSVVVITTGTFLNGTIHVGMTSTSAGRLDEPAATGLSASLKSLGFRLGRLKTGTTPRLDARSLDTTKMTVQPGDPEPLRFSFKTVPSNRHLNQIDCYLTGTTRKTHHLILDNLDRSPMFQKKIKGVGPRYCPSIEDKIFRFKNNPSHQIFIEPEGRNTHEIYCQGLNTSLPQDVQDKMIQSIPGLESAKILKYGYAVEYDFIYPSQLKSTLESQVIKGLFFAGQINGTSGYEEAAGQGIVAGINAGAQVRGLGEIVFKREDSYIGTMIDDLITKDIYEPYRMLTSRSEYRLLLRQDNAIYRLGEIGYQVGLLSEDEIGLIRRKKEKVKAAIKTWSKQSMTDDQMKMAGVKKNCRVSDWVKRPEVTEIVMRDVGVVESGLSDEERTALIDIKYSGYIQRQERDIARIRQNESRKIPDQIDFSGIKGLKKESVEKLNQYRPQTFYEAKRLEGINPADLMVLLTYISQRNVSRETFQR